MSHLPDGILITPLLIAGAGGALGAVHYGLKQLTDEQLPQTAVLAAVFFVASLISVPLGPSSVHLLLNGLMGLLLGWAAVPALLIGLLLQALFFGHGGMTTLGINLINIALPALLCAGVLKPFLTHQRAVLWLGAAAGFIGVMGTMSLVALELVISGRAFLPAAQLLLFTALPLAVVEAIVTAATVRFLQHVEPQLLTTRAVTAHG